MAAEKIDEHEKSAKNIIWQLFLIVTPWLIFWTVKEFWSHLGILLFGPMKAPVFGALAPFELFLVVGVVIAWRRNFPLWSYTWIGMLYFFGYREIFQIVIEFALKVSPENPELIMGGFYFIVNPLALAFLLALITRRDWLSACFTAYPYGSIVQAWYTLDKTPIVILVISLALYGFFAFSFMLLKSRPLKFVSLLAGTLVIGGGFFLYKWDLLVGGLPAFIFVNVRHILIITFPVVIYKMPLYRRLFSVERPRLAGG